MKYLFTLLIVAITFVFSTQNSFALVPPVESFQQQEVQTSNSTSCYLELETALEEFCKDFVVEGSVVEVSINTIDANLIRSRDDSDRAISLEVSVNSQQKVIFFDSLMDDKKEEDRLKENLRLHFLAEEYVAGAPAERINEILHEVEEMEEDMQNLFRQISGEMMDDKNNEDRLKLILKSRLTSHFSQDEKNEASDSFNTLLDKLEYFVKENSLEGLSFQELGEKYTLILDYRSQIFGNLEYVILYETVGLITLECAKELRTQLNELLSGFKETSDQVLQILKESK